MKQLRKMPVKHQYSFVQALYWMTSCALCGYAAVYLQDRGLSNALIGVVLGGGACLSILAQPLLAQLAEKVKFLSVKKVIQLLIILMSVLFMILTLAPLPTIGVMIIYMAMNVLNSCMSPLLSAMGMEFINRGYYLNFGFSRGMGSIFYAMCAAVLGVVIDKFFPGVLGYIYVFLAALLMIIVSSMEELKNEEKTVTDYAEKTTEENIWKDIVKDRMFMKLMLGFCLMMLTNLSIATYTVNIVRSLGGSESLLGIGNFINAASELPAMLLFNVLLKKYGCTRLLKVSAVFFVAKPLIILFAGNIPAVFLGLATQGPSVGLFVPASVYYVNKTMAPEKRVRGQAVFSMITSGAASCLGNFLGGWIIDTFGLQVLLQVCVVIAVVGCLIVVSVRENSEERMPIREQFRR